MSNTTNKVVLVPAVADISAAHGDTTTWMASGAPGTVFEGLYALGESFFEARRQLAATVWLALSNGAIDVEGDCGDVAAVRVLATTRKTFAVTELDT